MSVALGTALGLPIGTSLGWPDPDEALAQYLSTITSLQAWWDPTSDAYFTFSTGAQISAWLSRSGALGAQVLAQGTSANQPLRNLATSTLGYRNTVLFDGTADVLVSSAAAATWKFLHDGTGFTMLSVVRPDSTGDSIQLFATTGLLTSQSGLRSAAADAGVTGHIIYRSVGGTWVNNAFGANAVIAKDTSGWLAVSGLGTALAARKSGASVSGTPTGHAVSSADPATSLTIGGGATQRFKGHLGDMMFFNAQLPAATITNIAGLLAQKWQVAA